MQNWKDLYLELATKIESQMPDIRWVDLWHNQVNFLEDEHPFPTPAVFIGLRSQSISDASKKVQQLQLQVDFYLFYETFTDTYQGGVNQEDALAFVDNMDLLNALFHGSYGSNYSNMRRVGFAPVDTGNAGNLYQISYNCLLMDYSALKQYQDGTVTGIQVEQKPLEKPKDEEPPIFKI